MPDTYYRINKRQWMNIIKKYRLLRSIMHSITQKKEQFTGSAKRLNKNGCTSSRVSGPPRFNNSTPIFPSSRRGDADVALFWEVNNAPNGNEDLLSGCFKDKDCVPDHPKGYLGTREVFEELILLTKGSILSPEQWDIIWEEHTFRGNNLWDNRH